MPGPKVLGRSTTTVLASGAVTVSGLPSIRSELASRLSTFGS